MSDIQPSTQLVNPATGEPLSLDSPSPELGRYLADLREFESVLREFKRLVSRELLSRMDREASWTLRADELKIVGQSPAPSEEWDGAELRQALLEHVDAGRLSVEAVDAAVETIISYKTRKAGITALRKLGGPIAETVNGLARTAERERRVTVSRNG
jgi:hypothetical protein